MGYHGMGMQRWISTMKPRKFLGKRSKPDGGGGEATKGRDIGEYYHLKNRDLDQLRNKKYPLQYKRKLRIQLARDRRISMFLFLVSIAISLLALAVFVAYLNSKIHWF